MILPHLYFYVIILIEKFKGEVGGFMPIRKVKGGYKYGKTGKVYKSRVKAVKQGRAIAISKKRRKK